jgi:methylenetetrahydrofolate dehydrogenase (NADP+)/methenyltetrahydrofolate cyclohydrolase
MAELLKGAQVADALNASLAKEIETLKAKGVAPTLAIVRVGERGDDIAYERSAMKRCEKVGVTARQVTLPGDITEDALLKQIEALNADTSVHGVLLSVLCQGVKRRPRPQRARA